MAGVYFTVQTKTIIFVSDLKIPKLNLELFHENQAKIYHSHGDIVGLQFRHLGATAAGVRTRNAVVEVK